MVSTTATSSWNTPAAEQQQPHERPPGCAMRKDPCYYKYEEALQCLDKNDYQQDLCAEAFQAFKACRAHQMTTGVTATLEGDPVIGWAFKAYNKWSGERAAAAQLEQQQQEQQQIEEQGKPWQQQAKEQAQQQQQAQQPVQGSQQVQQQQQQQPTAAEEQKPWWRKPRQQGQQQQQQ